MPVEADGARRAAGAADAAVVAGDEIGPLHGVPITVKDALATAGMRTTSGEAPRRAGGRRGGRRPPARRRLRDHRDDERPRGVTGQETFNRLFGRTSNPWDRGRTPGGSSGGAAAALAAG